MLTMTELTMWALMGTCNWGCILERSLDAGNPLQVIRRIREGRGVMQLTDRERNSNTTVFAKCGTQ